MPTPTHPRTDAAPQAPRDDEQLAVAAFELFNKGMGPREVVVALRAGPERVSKAWQAWGMMHFEMHVPGQARLRIEECLGITRGTLDAAKLIEAAAELARLGQFVRSFSYKCAGCGQPDLADADDWAFLLQEGHMAEWKCATCGT